MKVCSNLLLPTVFRSRDINRNFLTCAKADIIIGLDSLDCSKWRKISMSRCNLDLDRKMSNVELVQAISILHV